MAYPVRAALAALILFAASTAPGQELAIPEVDYPALPPSAGNAEGFAPPGWRVETQAQGDLNADGAPDLAVVLRMQDAANILAHDGLGSNPFDSNPRILAMALGAAGGGYRLVVQNHALIPRPIQPTEEDPYSGIEIARGALKITLARMMNAGGWDAGTTAFTLRWREGSLRLIGFDYFNAHRASGEFTRLSINYLTGRVETATGNVARDAERLRRTRLTARPLPTLEEIGDGLDFDPEGAISRLP